MKYEKGVAAFIIKEKELLLLKRKREPFQGYWEVPAGKVESEDVTLEDAVVREVAEETNLLVEPMKEIGINRNDIFKFESHMFLAQIISGELHNNEPEKHSEARFFSLTQLPEHLGSTTQRGIELLQLRQTAIREDLLQ